MLSGGWYSYFINEETESYRGEVTYQLGDLGQVEPSLQLRAV